MSGADNLTAVVGGSGFVGGQLIPQLLAAGRQVRVIDRSPSPLYPQLYRPCDVRDLSRLVRAIEGCTSIIHLAAEHRDDVRPRSLYDEVNVGGAWHVREAAQRLDIRRIVLASSVAVYGLPDGPADERAPVRPINEYGRTKWEAEQVFRGWLAAEAGRSLAILRPTVIFGAGNRGNFWELMRQIASGRFVMIGDGRNHKSLAYVENVAAALSWCLNLGPGEHLFNYADGPDYDMNDLVSEIRGALGQPAAGSWRAPFWMGLGVGMACDAAAGLTRRRLPLSTVRVRKFCADTQIVAARILDGGFRPPAALAEALRRTAAYEFGGLLRSISQAA